MGEMTKKRHLSRAQSELLKLMETSGKMLVHTKYVISGVSSFQIGMRKVQERTARALMERLIYDGDAIMAQGHVRERYYRLESQKPRERQ